MGCILPGKPGPSNTVKAHIMELDMKTLILFTALAVSAAAQKGYQCFVTGNSQDVQTKTSFGLGLMGGGTDLDQAFRWMVEKSGGGDFVILRASGTDAYNPYVAGLGKLNSVTTILIKDRSAASDPVVLEKVRNAEALFFAGGDQANYVKMWRDTPLAEAIQGLVKRNVPIGGTSAGLAILGQYYFSALVDTVQSPAALADPYDPKLTVGRDFLSLPFMQSAITDTHFVKRDRLGRTIAFLARIVQDGWSTKARGIAVDEKNAVLVESDGRAFLVGEGAAYFFETTSKPEAARAKTPLTLRDVQVYRIRKDSKFDLASWKGTGGTAYAISAVNGVLSSTQAGGGIY
jgi:cyanophycinase